MKSIGLVRTTYGLPIVTMNITQITESWQSKKNGFRVLLKNQALLENHSV